MSEAALRERVDVLEEENRQLRQLLAVDPTERFIVAAKAKLKLQPGESKLLYTLVFSVRTTREALFRAYCDVRRVHLDPKAVDVRLFHVRRALKPHGITIETIWGHGYEMSPENRAKVLSLLGLERA